MMAYDNFTTTSCPSAGVFDELIIHGASTMHHDDKEIFAATFEREKLIRDYNNGVQTLRLVTRQLGDDGIYRRVETVDYFVKSNYSDDVLAITFCDNLPDEQETIDAIEADIKNIAGVNVDEIMAVIRRHINSNN